MAMTLSLKNPWRPLKQGILTSASTNVELSEILDHGKSSDLEATGEYKTLHPRSTILYKQVSLDQEWFRIPARAVIADPRSG